MVHRAKTLFIWYKKKKTPQKKIKFTTFFNSARDFAAPMYHKCFVIALLMITKITFSILIFRFFYLFFFLIFLSRVCNSFRAMPAPAGRSSHIWLLSDS